MTTIKRLLAVLLMLALLSGSAALGESRGIQPGTELVVGSTTAMSGQFYSSMFGYNTTDMDVRLLLHGYGTVAWTQGYQYQLDKTTLADVSASVDGRDGKTYVFTLADDLYWNDGTPITAADYVFTVLLRSSPMVAELGGDNTLYSPLTGYQDYASGNESVFSGVRLLDQRRFSLQISQAYQNDFYQLTYVDVQPTPVHVLAPDCTVADEGQGAFIQGAFTAQLLQSTLMGGGTGYLYQPWVTCGPYMLESVDVAQGTASFVINPYYKGNYEGATPHVERVRIVPVTNENMFAMLDNGQVDVLHKVSRLDCIQTAQSYAQRKQGSLVSYPRAGYGFLAFACEQSPVSTQKTRQAIALCLDKDKVASQFGGEYALRVYGCYGYGQWMPLYQQDGSDMLDALNTLPKYDMDLSQARRLLEEDGWVYSTDGGPYVSSRGGLRCRKVSADGQTVYEPLSLKMAKAQGSESAEQIIRLLEEPFRQLGIGLEVTELPFADMLSHYYRQTDRTYDLFYLATNFNYVFDPSLMYSTADEHQGTLNTSGLRDKQLEALALDMRHTAPGDNAAYAQKWLRFQQRWAEVLPAIPLYSNVYFDLYPADLNGYQVDSFSSWALTMPYAWYDGAAFAQGE